MKGLFIVLCSKDRRSKLYQSRLLIFKMSLNTENFLILKEIY